MAIKLAKFTLFDKENKYLSPIIAVRTNPICETSVGRILHLAELAFALHSANR